MNEINKKRKVIASGKRVLLKDQTVITTEVIYEQIKACEKATENRRNATGRTKRNSGLQVALNSANVAQRKEKAQDVVMLDEIVVLTTTAFTKSLFLLTPRSCPEKRKRCTSRLENDIQPFLPRIILS